MTPRPLDGKVALVAGATRGAGRGIAAELGAAGATVYVTGRSTRAQRSEMNRPETIEETAEIVEREGGRAIPVPVDHLEPQQVQELVARIDREQGRLDVLVNDVWGSDFLIQWNTPVWEHSLERGLRMLRLAVDTHVITSHFALPLLIRRPGGLVIEVTDGTAEYNQRNYRVSLFYDLAKTSVVRMAWALAKELEPRGGIAVPTDHLEADQVRALVERMDAEQGRLDVLVNDIWGGERLFQWNTPLWEHDLANGLRMLRLQIDTHLITSHFALPLLIRRSGGLVVEMTDGTREYNDANYREPAFYDLAKSAVIRLAFAQSKELAEHGCAAVALTPGWLRSEMMLEAMGVTEDNWREGRNPHFAAISESPRFVGRAVAALAADPDVLQRSGGSFSSGGLAREYGFTDVDGSQPDCWRYMVEVQDPGLPADPTGYR